MDFRVIFSDAELPAQVFFNSIPDVHFVSTIGRLSKRIGAGFNEAFCEFPEPGNEFEGVRFLLPGEEVVVSGERFREFLAAACDAYIAEHPADAVRLQSALAANPNAVAEASGLKS